MEVRKAPFQEQSSLVRFHVTRWEGNTCVSRGGKTKRQGLREWRPRPREAQSVVCDQDAGIQEWQTRPVALLPAHLLACLSL